jgi:hypothetical protein
MVVSVTTAPNLLSSEAQAVKEVGLKGAARPGRVEGPVKRDVFGGLSDIGEPHPWSMTDQRDEIRE